MPFLTREGPIPEVGRGAPLALAGGSVAAVAACWSAPLAGVPVPVVALTATAAFMVAVGILMETSVRRRRRKITALEVQRALALSEARFKLLADNAADVIVAADRDMVRRFVSPSARAVLGYAPEDLVGRAAFDIIHPDDLAGYRQAVVTLLDGLHAKIVTTLRYRRHDGVYIWTEEHLQVTRDAASRPSGYVGSLRDVTDRHVAAAAVRDSEAFLRGIIDSSPECIKVLDLNGELQFMSRNGLYMLDYMDGDAPIGRDFATLWPEETRSAVRSAVSAAAAGAASRFRARAHTARARSLFLDVVVAPIAGADGTCERLIALSRDITAEAEAESELQLIQDRYRLLAENSSDVVMLRAPGHDGTTLYVSPSSVRMLGHAPERLAEGYPCDLVHPDDRCVLKALLDGLEAAGDIVRHTHRVRRADDSFIWVEGVFQTARRSGAPVVVAALRDVTERQQRAQDLAAAKEIAERAQRSAEQASEAKSDFLAAMSHEIRTPLNSIIGFTDLMLDAGDLPATAQRQAELIRASGAALLTVLNDVLDFSRVEAGAVDLEALPFSPVALARHCAAILRGYAGTKALDIEVEIGERLPPCLVGDEARLRQVLLNLLNNAVKFTPRGRVTLRVIGLGAAPGGAEAVRFEVMDTGIGIAPDQQHRLFERFSQVDSSVARRFGGSGLGLAICKKLVELMGGSIGLSSRSGAGSTFWFTVALPAVSEPVPRVVPVEHSKPAARRGRVLVVEDIEINQRLAVALLEAAGHTVDVLGDGAPAVGAVAEKAYDLVLMDVQMPGMDGITATRLIRQSTGPHRGLPIVAMTANVFPEQIAAFYEAGMDGHIGKPLNRAQLYATVERWISQDRVDRVGSASALPVEAPLQARVAPDSAPTFDPATFAQLDAYLGPERLDDVLARFAASLPHRFAPGRPTPEALRQWNADAHVVLSVAGMTGFVDLARHCRTLEAALPDLDLYATRLDALRATRDAALRDLAVLRSGLTARIAAASAVDAA